MKGLKCIGLLVAVLVGLFGVISADDSAETCTAPTEPGSVPDCNCKFNSVDYAVKHFISPILSNLTTKAFFRYFKVDLNSPCPFWSEAAQCAMEGCSVCTCEENEIPKPWLETESKRRKTKPEYGWISAANGDGNSVDDSALEKISVAEGESADLRLDSMYKETGSGRNGMMEVDIGTAQGIQSEPEYDHDDSDEWTVLNGAFHPSSTTTRNLPAFASAYGYGALFEPVDTAEEVVSDAAYVNLLENPERFTGYSGPSAQRVWRSIQLENCFGELSDVCLEKRIFYRVMSGLQASISTHIARNYRQADGQWGPNYPLYWRAVGDHPDRLNNMYFAFLFLLRAVVRAQDTIRKYPYNTGHPVEDGAVHELLEKLLATSHGPNGHTAADIGSMRGGSFYDVAAPGAVAGKAGTKVSPAESSLKALLRADVPEMAMSAVGECRYGFNESDMFQVSATLKGPQYWNTLEEKQALRDEFMIKFRNISRIMDCVTCDKCRVWGKLQILGFGTAIKILLHPADKIVTPTATVSKDDAHTAHSAACDVLGTTRSARLTLSRQEIIALLNTLHQFGNSLLFAAEAAQLAQRVDVPQEQISFASVVGQGSPDVGAQPEDTGKGKTKRASSKWKGWVFLGVGYVAPLLLLAAIGFSVQGRRKEQNP